jgi:glycosyltransferase involved in cell wall biosynthesis
MAREPLVSIIIPTYNRAGLICETIDNVFQQTYRNFELIVVDDGSTDDTQSKLLQYGNRIQVIRQENRGPAVARNRGARVARGEIIAFQDSDDLWKPTKLERQVLLLEMDSSLPCCLSNIALGAVEGKEFTSFDQSFVRPKHDEGIWLNVSDILATRFVLFTQAVAIRREVFVNLGGFDESLRYLEDYDFPLRLSFMGPWGFIREPLVTYRKGSSSSFSQAALNDPITLKHCELKICERMLAEVKPGRREASFRRHLKRRMGIFRRELRAIELGQKGFCGARAMAKFLMSLELYFVAAFRHSPWYPEAITAPLQRDMNAHIGIQSSLS